ncbi:MAG TPA: hypothetical protein VMB50_03530 [Myxococcales bacterium]|nr:hypothetical protein [Myxococcales bacterium]
MTDEVADASVACVREAMNAAVEAAGGIASARECRAMVAHVYDLFRKSDAAAYVKPAAVDQMEDDERTGCAKSPPDRERLRCAMAAKDWATFQKCPAPKPRL